METNNSAAEKRIVEELNFGAKTAKRVGWEQFEFSIESPHLVRVTNASYGFEKDDHSYLVGVEVRDGTPVPAECECPANKYNEEYDCKHKVALATVGGSTVLDAAVKVRADGGNPDKQEGDDCLCTPDFPCAECYINGERELPK